MKRGIRICRIRISGCIIAWDSSGEYYKMQLKRGKEELNLDNKKVRNILTSLSQFYSGFCPAIQEQGHYNKKKLLYLIKM
jgi:hypothetical protein